MSLEERKVIYLDKGKERPVMHFDPNHCAECAGTAQRCSGCGECVPEVYVTDTDLHLCPPCLKEDLR